MNKKLNRIDKLLVKTSDTIKQTMRAIDQAALGIAFIVDNQKKLCGVVTDGDIRRAILNGTSIDETPIEIIMKKNPVVVRKGWSEGDLYNYLQKNRIFAMLSGYSVMKVPVIDDNHRITDIMLVSKKKPKGDERSVVLVGGELVEEKQVNKVLVVGGAGYLGSILCRRLLEKRYIVRVLDILMYGDVGIEDLYTNPKFDLLKGDIRDLQVVMQGLKGMDAVIHLAAIVGDSAAALKPQEAIEINFLSAKLIAETCKHYQINRFIFASTCSVYGASSEPEERLNEESVLNPVSLYALMKLKSENGILELLDENFAPTILRMATLYGLSPRMRFDLVANTLSAKAIVDKEITIFGGNQWRPILHVKDAAEAFVRCLEEPIGTLKGRILNVGSNAQNYQIKEIGEIVHKVIPDAKLLTNEENADRRNYNVSFDKIKRVLNYEANYTVEDAVAEIRDAIEGEVIRDYTSKRYSNYKYLSEKED